MNNGFGRTGAQVGWDRQRPEHLDGFNDTRVTQHVFGASPRLIGRDQHQLLQQPEVMLDQRRRPADSPGQFAESLRLINECVQNGHTCGAHQ